MVKYEIEISDRLMMYKTARDEFNFARSEPIICCISGFCYYFAYVFGLDILDPQHFKHLLPELYSVKPKHNRGFWFEEGDIIPRIGLLDQAIYITEQKLKNNSQTICQCKQITYL